MTPDSIPAQALDRSKVIASVAPMACATALLIVGSCHRISPRNLMTLQLIITSIDSAGRDKRLRQSSAVAVARVYESSSPPETRRPRMPVSHPRPMWVR